MAELAPLLISMAPNGARKGKWDHQLAIKLGGHVRAGFENNLMTPEGKTLADSAEQVTAMTQLATQHNRSLVTAAEAWEMF